jgi:ATP-dependent helicase/nuclease subunit A
MLLDHHQRQQATDPQQSFIVQAPAGSGKTEILTQRFLRLLATVNAPEQIIALTFTRKAANEMRERIITALKNAEADLIPSSDHQKLTLAFAKKALLRDQQFNWQLTSQPSRLRIMTIDALCQFITQAIPLQEKEIPYAEVSEQSDIFFINAANNCIRHAIKDQSYQTALKQLLLHLDNQQQRLIDLFTELLAKREQWLQLIYEGRAQDKTIYEQALLFIEQHELNRFRHSLPKDLAEQLVNLAREMALIENDPNTPRYSLQEWSSFEQSDARTAKALASLLLNAKGDSLRKGFDHHVGLRKDSCDPDTFAKIKTKSKLLFEALNEQVDFFEALSAVKDLPPPTYDDQQWTVLNALFALLPLLAAHLQLEFAEQHSVDFTAISHQALMALGTEEEPTDLALYLDHSIQHLLIDEFQDTSITQFRLIEQLTAGWTPDDGKTLFVVGDPMQSIYRFRQAEVGLFLQAQQSGIAQLKLTPLYLQCNFRSKPNIVQWVNKHFTNIFPKQADIESGAVPFSVATEVLDDDSDSIIEALYYSDQQQQAQGLIDLVQNLHINNPEESIAILVRSRNQLRYIVPLLRAKQIPFQGVEIDLLSQLSHIKDIWILTQCLLMPGNRLAWLSLLRSPYVGLSLKDIHRIAQINLSTSIYSILSKQDSWLQQVSDEARQRLNFIFPALNQAIKHRHQQKLSQWVIETHKELLGNHILNHIEQKDLEQFWLLLDKYEKDGQLEDFQQFDKALNQLYSKQVAPAKLQIMTIHKSKGLEFDNVILPGLSAPIKNPDRPLLRWLKLPTEADKTLLLMSPVKAASEENDALYDYLARLDQQKDHYELQRLLYVATTRAKKRLYLLDYKEKAPKNSFRTLLKNQAFNAMHQTPEEVATKESNDCYHLPLTFYQDKAAKLIETAHNRCEPITLSDASLVGVITHQLLQWVCDTHPENPDAIPWHLAKNELRQNGIDEQRQIEIIQLMQSWICKLFACPKGQWIISKHHQEKNEYPLLIKQDNQLQTRIIDRVFFEENQCWIIDFKTGSGQSDNQEKHIKQLNEYAQIMSHRTQANIHCGLYYLANQQWYHWQPELTK